MAVWGRLSLSFLSAQRSREEEERRRRRRRRREGSWTDASLYGEEEERPFAGQFSLFCLQEWDLPNVIKEGRDYSRTRRAISHCLNGSHSAVVNMANFVPV